MATFRDCWNTVSLMAGVPDPILCRMWVQWAYNQFCDRRHWSHLRKSLILSVHDQKIGECTVVRGSATVTGGTLTFAASDVGRQFRLGSIPIYTIVAVDTAGPTTATLDLAYAEASQTVRAFVLDAYVTLPEDFHTFYTVLDPVNRWRLRWWLDSDVLNRWDPARQSTGNARMLTNQQYSPVEGFRGCPRYELYPYQTSARTYPVWYYAKPANLQDEEEIRGPLARRSTEILSDGALARCALWPGTAAQKNPYFSPALAQVLRTEFETKLVEVEVVDEELYFEELPLTQFGYADWPWDSAWLQSHEPYIIG